MRNPLFGLALVGGLLLAALGACGSTRDRGAEQAAASQPTMTAATNADAAPSDAAPDRVRAAKDNPIPASTRQLVLGIAAEWESTQVRLALFERTDEESPWQRRGEWFPAVVGKGGLGWGRGLHGDGPPTTEGQPGAPIPRKSEGDGRAPLGVFRLAGAFGHSKTPPITKMGYTTMTPTHRCVDDQASPFYNRIVDEAKIAPSWDSAEDMFAMGEVYDLGIVIEHNAARVPRMGSCIFFHIWRDAAAPTAGCTAMPREKLAAMIEWLEPESAPVYVLLPKAEHARLAPHWGLPPL